MKTIYKFIKLSFAICFILNGYSQEMKHIEKNYPQGVYVTFDDFKNQNATGAFSDYNFKIGGDSISYRFFDPKTDKKMKKEFAFSDGTDLYVSMRAIMKNLEKEDKGQVPDQINYYLKAINIGNRYIYFEDHFTSSGAAMWGGAIASAAARRVKGILFDRDSNTFNLFKNAEDFENFISTKHPDYLPKLNQANSDQKRKKKVEDIDLIREIIYEVNKG